MIPLTKRPQTKKWVWPAVAIIVLLLAVGGYWLYQQSRQTPPPAGPSEQAGASKADLPDNQTVPSSDKVPNKQDVKVTITKVELTGNNVVIEGDVIGAPDAGTCVAEFTTPNDNPVIGETKLTENNTKCGPVALPAADFAYLGEWNVTLTVYTGGGKAVSPAKTITIK